MLIADDNPFNIMPLEMVLESMFDIAVDTAEDGDDEVDMFKANMEKTCCDVRYKLVLTDLNMPRMDGFTAAEQITAYQKRRGVKNLVRVAAITAYENDTVVDRCMKIGMAKVLNKPVSAEAIREILNEYYFP